MAKDEKKAPIIKLNMREEAFCNFMVAIKTDTWSNRKLSAIAAGYSEKSGYRIGTKLLGKSHIVAKIKELRQKAFEKMAWDREACLLEYEHDRNMAREKEQYSTAKDITTKIGEIGGFFKQRVDVTTTESHVEVQPLTDIERRAAVASARTYNEVMSRGDTSVMLEQRNEADEFHSK